VTPPNGFTFNTTFTLSASLWNDPDLPLAYSFGFIDTSGANILLTQQAVAFSNRFLPAGQDTNEFNVNCVARVFDSYNAFTDSSTPVRVKKLEITPAALSNRGNLQVYNYT
jgi:hypothetical protein